jgi:hypothetical protein
LYVFFPVIINFHDVQEIFKQFIFSTELVYNLNFVSYLFVFIKRALKLILHWPMIFGRWLIEMSLTRGPARTSFSSKRIVSATINYTVPWKIFVVACIGIFGKEYQSAYWIVGARITLWLDSKSGSRDVYCYRNDIEGTTCLHRPSINPLATASNFPAVPSPANCAYTEIQNLF